MRVCMCIDMYMSVFHVCACVCFMFVHVCVSYLWTCVLFAYLTYQKLRGIDFILKCFRFNLRNCAPVCTVASQRTCMLPIILIVQFVTSLI